MTDECGLLTTNLVPQGYQPDGKPIWYCKCKKFRTNSFDELRMHVEGIDTGEDDHIVLSMIAGIGAGSSLLAYCTGFDWKVVGITSISIFLIPFIINKTLNWRKNRISSSKAPTPQVATLSLSEEEEIKKHWKIREEQRKKILASRKANHIQFIEDSAEDYDPSTASCLQRFKSITKVSECFFARSAKIWGSAEYDSSLTIEQNVHRSLKALMEGLSIGEKIKLDGFLFEVRGKEFGDTLESFGETVRRILTAISDHDPECDHSMDSDLIDRRGWRYMFNGQGIFVTCFGPCYSSDNARYSYDQRESVFVLIQPHFSFTIHDIGEDHPWDDTKKTSRQKIRQTFKDAGREYYVPKARFYPSAPMIVPPHNITDPLLEWYKRPEGAKKVHDGDIVEDSL